MKRFLYIFVLACVTLIFEMRLHATSSSFNYFNSNCINSFSLSSTQDDLLYKGNYTISSQGYCPELGTYTSGGWEDFYVTIEIYDGYINVNGVECKYIGSSNGWKTYKASGFFAGDYYKVNSSTFEMTKYNVTFNSYTGQNNTFVYQMKKGKVIFDKHKQSSNSSSTNTSTRNTSSGQNKRSTYQKDCHLCGGSGKCITCNGRHKFFSDMNNRYLTCPNCKIDGKCSSCGGTGKKR